MKRFAYLFITGTMILASCNNDIEPGPPITPAAARDTLYSIMKSYYYWYKNIPLVNKNDYANPYEILEALKYKALDRWSFVADYEDFMNEMQGTFVGHGIRIGLDPNSKARIIQIYANAPLYSNGVRRGWIIESVNGIDIAPIIAARDAQAYNDAFGPATPGTITQFVFKKPDGSSLSLASQKSSFQVNSVILCDTIWLDKAGTKIAGHLVLESFIEPTVDELNYAFTWLKARNVTEMIIDLRYNSGGYLDVAQQLASYLGGNVPAGTTFAKLSYNDKWQVANQTFPFLATSLARPLQKIVVITSRVTASASEAVMNSLTPHINVVSIGDTTDGKPVGMNGWPIGQEYYFCPVTFKLLNSSGTGDYFDGIAPAKTVIDDVTRDFNDQEEACLKEAILYLKTGSFSSKGSSEFSKVPQFSEKPSWMNNLFSRDPLR